MESEVKLFIYHCIEIPNLPQMIFLWKTNMGSLATQFNKKIWSSLVYKTSTLYFSVEERIRHLKLSESKKKSVCMLSSRISSVSAENEFDITWKKHL